MSGVQIHSGIFLHILSRVQSNNQQVFLIGKNHRGQVFVSIEKRFRPWFFLPKNSSAEEFIKEKFGNAVTSEDNVNLLSMSGSELQCFSVDNGIVLSQINYFCQNNQIPSFWTDLSVNDQYRIRHRLSLFGTVEGNQMEAQKRAKQEPYNLLVDTQYTNKRRALVLTLLSLDIETNAKSQVQAIGLSFWKLHYDPDKHTIDGFDADKQWVGVIKPSGSPSLEDTIEGFANESSLLKKFISYLEEYDPDILTGWNVIEFDLAILFKRSKEHKLSLKWGRSQINADYLDRSNQTPGHMEIPGRIAIDGNRLVRMAGKSYPNYKLETVANDILGRGKQEKFTDTDKLAELERLFQDDPDRYASYCLEDASLVAEILKKTSLLSLLIHKADLTGVPITRALSSIPVFDHLYTQELFNCGIAAPSAHNRSLAMGESPGGTIIEPFAGLYPELLVFDFKSLYPSIIKTFGIDPWGHIQAKSLESGVISQPDKVFLNESDGTYKTINSPNGGIFLQGGILPQIISRFFQYREEAKRAKNDTASFVYKILMNSFYGVLGSPMSKFSGSILATAITSFAKELLLKAKELISEKGYSVLYGDTDSLFVTHNLKANQIFDFSRDNDAPIDESNFKEGSQLCKEINRELANYVEEKYGLKPELELEFEYILSPCFFPALRDKNIENKDLEKELKQHLGHSQAKGRAKGYAGLVFYDNYQSSENQTPELLIKGMEAVRGDWTKLAQNLQRGLLKLVFSGQRKKTLSFLETALAEIKDPNNLENLVYSKRLSKRAEDYTKTQPPHVKAALLLPPKERRGKIHYVLTTNGPEPLNYKKHPIDLSHYMEKQVLPIVKALEDYIDPQCMKLLEMGDQLSLF